MFYARLQMISNLHKTHEKGVSSSYTRRRHMPQLRHLPSPARLTNIHQTSSFSALCSVIHKTHKLGPPSRSSLRASGVGGHSHHFLSALFIILTFWGFPRLTFTDLLCHYIMIRHYWSNALKLLSF